METEADGITADMEITELNRRDVPVVRFNPADIGEDVAVSLVAASGTGLGIPPRPPEAGHSPESVLESVQNQASIWVR
ncbi:hypothetical protein SAMN04487981_109218 [Streptomyces sp. cf386]|nr:hypothetical protein SAMN04487981_109218 [Streptomyces sp. cf386]